MERLQSISSIRHGVSGPQPTSHQYHKKIAINGQTKNSK